MEYCSIDIFLDLFMHAPDRMKIKLVKSVLTLCLCVTVWHLIFFFNILGDGTDYVFITKSLKKSLVDIDNDVLHMDVDKMLNMIGSRDDLHLKDSRLVDKLLRSRVYPHEGCVIRITKYCGNRCDHMLWNFIDDPTEWIRFTCPFARPCVIETRFVGERNLTKRIMKSTDVLILVDSLHKGLHLNQLMSARPRGQLWVLVSRESPQHDHEYVPPAGSDNPYNLTMTYAPDSDLYFPYCYSQRKLVSEDPPIPRKTKLLAWMASNCHRLSWRRGELVEELQKFLPIDTFGKCGELGRLADVESVETLRDYKFYLAFENSECKEYITEKIWRTSLQNGIVPIVYGSSREDYERILPHNSFIYLEDFSSMSDFVDFIYELDRDEERYNRYFDWKKDREIVCLSARFFVMFAPEVNMCYLLQKLIHVFLYPETSWQNRESDFTTWWQDQCIDSTVRKEVLGFDVHQPKTKKKKTIPTTD